MVSDNVREMLSVIVASFLMTIVVTLIIYYLIPMPLEYAVVSGFSVTVACIMVHELFHKMYAIEFCKRGAEFTLTKFAINVTLLSIFILSVLILIKRYTGWYTQLIPIVASPGGVYVAMRKADKCYDNIAIVAPLYNFTVGVALLIVLHEISSPPFVLNDISNFTVSLVAILSFFSIALAFVNTIPIRIGDVATDGYWALTIDRSDVVTKTAVLVVLGISFYLLFLTGWWVVIV